MSCFCPTSSRKQGCVGFGLEMGAQRRGGAGIAVVVGRWEGGEGDGGRIGDEYRVVLVQTRH